MTLRCQKDPKRILRGALRKDEAPELEEGSLVDDIMPFGLSPKNEPNDCFGTFLTLTMVIIDLDIILRSSKECSSKSVTPPQPFFFTHFDSPLKRISQKTRHAAQPASHDSPPRRPQVVAFSVCNPPFHETLEHAQRAASDKWQRLGNQKLQQAGGRSGGSQEGRVERERGVRLRREAALRANLRSELPSSAKQTTGTHQEPVTK